MEHSRRILSIGVAAAVLLLLASYPAAASATRVENYSVSGSAVVSLPGTTTKTGVQFDVAVTVDSVSFSSGHMLTSSSSVEMHGDEGNFEALEYWGTINVPVSSGPALVTVTATAGARDNGYSKTVPVVTAGSIEIGHVVLGSGFSANHFDVDTSSAVSLQIANAAATNQCAANLVMTSPNINEKVESASSSASLNLSGVDAATGVVSFSGLGDISVSGAGGSAGAAVPGVPLAGGLLLALGALAWLAAAVTARRPAPVAA